MDKKKQDKHSRVKTFIKTVNYNHLMPTRYTLDVDLKATVTPDALENATKKVAARKEAKKILEERKMIQMQMDEEMIEEDDLVKELMAKMEDPEMRVEAIRVLKMVSETERKRNEKRMQRDEEEKTKRFGPR